MTIWEKQNNEYKKRILNLLKIERHEIPECPKVTTNNEKVYHKYIPRAKIVGLNEKNINEEVLILPDEVEEIAEDVFSGLDIIKVVLPYNLRFLRAGAFKGCKKLKEVVFNDLIDSIEEYTFYGCGQLESVVFKGHVYSIGQYCFADCKSLKSVSFLDAEEDVVYEEVSIGQNAFLRCAALESVVLPQGIRKIKDGTFSHCASLKDIKFPKFLGYIGRAAFWGCKALEIVDLENHYTYIDYQAFTLSGIKKFMLPKYANILRGMILSKTQIAELVIPESVQKLEKDCLNIDTLKIVYMKSNKHTGDIVAQFKKAGISVECEIVMY